MSYLIVLDGDKISEFSNGDCKHKEDNFQEKDNNNVNNQNPSVKLKQANCRK